MRAATDGRTKQALRLLSDHPAVAKSGPWAATVLDDAARLRAELDADPGLATRKGGPRKTWELIHCAAFSRLHRSSAARGRGIVACARLQLERGADPNGDYAEILRAMPAAGGKIEPRFAKMASPAVLAVLERHAARG
jgi:hypothetical protein